jgi:thiol-disulfide isomerase/thioredoxin
MDVRSPLRQALTVALLAVSTSTIASAQQSPLPSTAQEQLQPASPSDVGFPERQELTLTTPRFQNRDISALTATLDRLLANPAGTAEARSSLWNFARQLQAGRMTPAQEAQVLKHLDKIGRARPELTRIVGNTQRMIRDLTPGKVAPEIIGTDLDGIEFQLKDYRGKVVVLLFSADWCGICRTLNPYERLMAELYKNWPFAIVSVETGANRELARRAKEQQGLHYRSWWDGSPGEEVEGPIASAWNVGGLPTLYVIDGDGVIRFVDVRYEDLLKAVRQLLNEQAAAEEILAKSRANAATMTARSSGRLEEGRGENLGPSGRVR